MTYDLALSLHAGRPDYEGDCTIRFEHRNPSAGAFLDFTGAEILGLTVNDQPVEDADAWRGHRITLDGSRLQPHNTVRVVYRNEYDHMGAGFHQFTDPEDGAEYLYTHFEPFDTHRLFPCFDQPDIKAHYRLRVTAPTAWTLVANYPPTSTAPADEGRSAHEFEETALFSPYLFALVAGPFHRFDDRFGDTPLAIYCRESLAPHMDPDEFFTVTKQGLAFYGEFFDYPYPFAKYDQVFVPEFNMGAMENVGCITFSDRMVFRDPPTDIQRLNRAEVVLHEMAHMWFGDLVTMRWWDDLWLNESFATYMAYVALNAATRFSDGAWAAFHSRMKAWAYEQDQLVTTHPIAGDVPDTDATFLNFDGITYGKGASVLKQLVAAIGADAFRDGMRHYFQTYAWGNTTLAEFLGALEHGAGRSLEAWSAQWLEQAGVNTIAPRLTLTGETIQSLVIEQTAPPDHPTLRAHRLELAVYDAAADGAPLLREAIPIDVDGERTVVEQLVGAPAPAALFPNHGDHDYAKTSLDDRSLSFVRERLERFEDRFVRLLLWQTLWEMVRDRQFRSPDYLAMVREKLPNEDALELTTSVLAAAQLAQRRYLPEPMRLPEARQLFDLAWAQLYAAEKADGRIVWARAVIGTAQEAETLAQVLALIDDGTGIDGFALDQEMRWSATIKAMAYAMPQAGARLAAELERDGSDRGQRAAETARVAAPEAGVKAAAWSRILEDRDASLHTLRAVMQGFFWLQQQDLVGEYVPRFFAELPAVFETRDRDYATTFFGALYPHHLPTADTIGRTEALLAELPDDEVMLRRSLREALDETQRAVACRAFAEG